MSLQSQPSLVSRRNPIIGYAVHMRTITATEASRGFSDLLDAVEQGETVSIRRGRRTVAVIGPAPVRTGRDLRAALAAAPRLDEDFERDVTAATTLLTEATDPWAGA